MNLGRTSRRRVSVFDMTPMIDVVLQLILFFMYTAQFHQVARTPIDLPSEAGDADSVEVTGGVIIDVRADGAVLIEREVISLDRMAGIIQAESKAAGPEGLSVLVRADQSAAMSHVNAVVDRLATLGVRTWRLATSTVQFEP